MFVFFSLQMGAEKSLRSITPFNINYQIFIMKKVKPVSSNQQSLHMKYNVSPSGQNSELSMLRWNSNLAAISFKQN